MKTLEHRRRVRPRKLLDELAAVPGLAPTGEGLDRQASFEISYDEAAEVVTLQVPDDVDDQAVAAVVDAHDETTPDAAEAAEEQLASTERTLDQRLAEQILFLQGARDAITANPPQLFATASNQERALLRNMIRNQLALIRLELRRLEGAD